MSSTRRHVYKLQSNDSFITTPSSFPIRHRVLNELFLFDIITIKVTDLNVIRLIRKHIMPLLALNFVVNLYGLNKVSIFKNQFIYFREKLFEVIYYILGFTTNGQAGKRKTDNVLALSGSVLH